MHRLIYSAGAQSVRSVPMRSGLPVSVASADYKLIDLRYSATSDGHVLASGAATIDSVSTTLAAAGGKSTGDPRALSVASATGIVAGRRYLLSSGGRTELVRVEAVSGTTLRLAATLPSYFASGSSFLGVEMVASIGADFLADDDYLSRHTLAIRWEPFGLPAFQEQIFVERVAPTPLVTPEALIELDATLPAFTGDGFTMSTALRLALEDFQVDLAGAGLDDTRIMTGPIGANAVKYRAAYHCLKHAAEDSAVRRAQAYEARYHELLANLLAGKDKDKVTKVNADNAAELPDVTRLPVAGVRPGTLPGRGGTVACQVAS